MSLCGGPHFHGGRHGYCAWHRRHVNSIVRCRASTLILRGSVAAGLARCPGVWGHRLKQFHVIHVVLVVIAHSMCCGGHSTSPYLTVRAVVLLCDTTNIPHDRPLDIASGIIVCVRWDGTSGH